MRSRPTPAPAQNPSRGVSAKASASSAAWGTIPRRKSMLRAGVTGLLLGASLADQGFTSPFDRKEQGKLLSLEHPLLTSSGAAVEQIHLTGAGSREPVLVSFVTEDAQASVVEYRLVGCDEHGGAHWGRKQDLAHCDAAAKSTAALGSGHVWKRAEGQSSVYSALNFYTATDDEGHPLWNDTSWGSYKDAGDWYTSQYIHSVPLRDLRPGGLYLYRIPPMEDREFAFRAPLAVGPGEKVRLGLIADLGQTDDSVETMRRVQAKLGDLDQALFVGDLSYADGYGPRWDSFGRLAEPLFSRVVSSCVGGNHEFSQGEAWVGLRERWPAPARTSFRGGTQPAPLFYSFEVGPAHILALNSYMDTGEASQVYRFVEEDLRGVDRARTPFLIAFWHTPWYTSTTVHDMSEGAAMRRDLEALLSEAGVDFAFTGHVHAYERTLPVRSGEVVDACDGGIVHITIGDGGNREGPALPWRDPQPSWSAFREASFGFGVLELDGHSARWEWYRNDGDSDGPAETYTTGTCDG